MTREAVMRIQIKGNEKSDFRFRKVPGEHVEKIQIAVTTTTNIIHACKKCTKRNHGRLGLHKAFENLIHKSCGRTKHNKKSLDQLMEDVWISWVEPEKNTIFGLSWPCMSTDEIALTPYVMNKTHLFIAGTIIHELAHLSSADIAPNSHQAESVLSQCCKLESVYNPLIMGKALSQPTENTIQQCRLSGQLRA
jgi:hypothetical protein